MKIFKKPYRIRRYSKKTWEGGVSTSPYKESVAYLDIQPQDGSVSVNSDGHWVVRKLKAYSDMELLVSDPEKQVDADRVLVNGTWYECIQCLHWDNTVLRNYQVILSAIDMEGNEYAIS